MAYGVTTSRAHLDALGAALEPSEIDWDAIRAWKGADPQFAGRYFLGTPTQQEVDADVGFCLWAHGEGTTPSAPVAVAPLQRADPTRQAALGSLGTKFGTEDARAIATYIERCADVGDITLPLDRYLVLVYLEVAAGASLSSEYWSAWAHYLKGTLLEFRPHGIVRPLEPAMACAFVQDSPQSPFLPDEAVRTCLSHPAPPGRYNLCKGFWCRTVLDNPVFGQFVQDPDHGPIPVRYRRTFDGPGGSPVPAGAPTNVLPTLALIAVDEPMIEPGDDPIRYTLEAQPWDPSAPLPPDLGTVPAFPPTQLGLDTAYRQTPPTREPERQAIAECVVSKEIVIRRLPAGFFGPDFGSTLELHLGTQMEGPDLLHGRPAFIARYLKPHFNGLTDKEAIDLLAAGLPVCSVWQIGREIVNGFGHARQAFASALEAGQPPYTPIYFSIDLSVGEPSGMHDATTVSPPLTQVVRYFRDIRRGYRQYLADGGTVPYYVGCYAAHNVLDAVYRAGLATHFWQPWPFDWGPPTPIPSDWSATAPGWRAWRHLNFWQVLLDNGFHELLDDNAAILDCTPDLDFNVAWGDPGSWVPG